MWQLILALLVGGAAVSSVKIVEQGNEALVERLGQYDRKLDPGLNLVLPFIDRIAYQETIREKVLDIPPQNCITRDNVAIAADAVVYWRIVDMEKAYYKVQNLQSAMINLVLTQIRAEMGKLELDETFTAREQINETLLRELDIATDPWGVKVTRVELREIVPAKAVQESMELQMSAERKKRAAILTSEGERESAINSARGKAESQVLDAEARKRATVMAAEAEQQRIVLEAQANRQQQVLKAQATAEALSIVTQALNADPQAPQAAQLLMALGYLTMGETIGKSNSSKVLFMDPASIPGSLAGMMSIVNNGNGQA
ncbi:SPFH domain-containing protein [Alkalinema sp. FACHB-956]|uniref:SPFH domain-containing protein n=1 Tax=Alkalinema sp. FACHB-956 TaxID=2692768 RepID=UPI00168320AA|nr:SPFH domain-containing protein [Alkalinema sp. FACHB-956]MBD2326810.1 SPFH/Band 7/PHB domain protein [Alkalinema sp. FACHB-956]